MLWHFTLDHSAAETAHNVRLSVNSIAVLFDKLRRFFTDLGVFDDVYNGGDPQEGIDGNDELMEYERRLIEFHRRRVDVTRRIRPLSEKQALLEAADLRDRSETLIAITQMSLARSGGDEGVGLLQ